MQIDTSGIPIAMGSVRMSGNVIWLNAARAALELNNSKEDDRAYHAKILSMSKLELLQEMIHFQEERSRIGHLTIQMMTRGKILFKALEESAENQELKLFSRSYRKHLDYELTDYLARASEQNSKASPPNSSATKIYSEND